MQIMNGRRNLRRPFSFCAAGSRALRCPGKGRLTNRAKMPTCHASVDLAGPADPV